MKPIIIIFFLFFSYSSYSSNGGGDLKITYDAVLKIEKALKYYQTDVEDILARFKVNNHIVLNKIEKNIIKNFWSILIDHRVVLHSLYNTYSKEAPSYENNLIRYTANLHLQKSAAIMSQILWDNKNARNKLDETNQKELPRGSFTNMENELFRNFNNTITDIDLPTMFPVHSMQKDMESFHSFNGTPRTEIEIELENLNKLSQQKLTSLMPFISNSKNISEIKKRFFIYKFKNLFYSISRKISTWLGDTKIRNRNPDYYNGQTLIDLKMAKKMNDIVKPGDVMISRTNWFLSNAFLPGFWPHSFLYIGGPNKMRAFFNTKEVNTFFTKLCIQKELKCNDMFSYLEKNGTTAKAFVKYLEKDKYGFEKVLMEGTSDGIHFSSVRHTFLNDYLAAMRPVVSKVAKAMTIVDSFESFGLEYDFDFDYQTDDRLVCTELVAKSYEKRPGKGGFSMNYNIDQGKYLEVILGRLALPVVNFVHKIYDENILKVRKPDLEFVAFLKGNREKKNSEFSTEKDFYESRDWKKWSFMRE
ncbi:MAG: hypothetical protein ACJAS4_000607 [Bacteriovoracaceae bacterium]